MREEALSSAIKVNPVLHEIILTFGVNDKIFTLKLVNDKCYYWP